MSAPTDAIRRRFDGSIDTEFYARRAAALRLAARRAMLRRWTERFARWIFMR
ncbi:MAG: hypothetical protein KF914_21645 [Rhizobiaceae bacterium]|nr:hypothetical protein [Rhizobiaceae bacterium]